MNLERDEHSLNELVVRLNNGDLAAAEQVFAKYEPYLRMIVRRQITGRLQAKFDSSDIVQSVWADLLVGFRDARWHFDDSGHLKAFLVKVTKNRFLDRVRQQRTTLQNERSLTTDDENHLGHEHAPRPSQQVRVDELWGEMVGSCSESHRVLLELKRQGKSLAEIAAQTGYHESSVRRILYDLARQFVAQRNHDSSNSKGETGNAAFTERAAKERAPELR